MKLEWTDEGEVVAGAREHPTTWQRYPSGYWYAQTDDGGFDGVGPDPLTAVCNLVADFERDRAEAAAP